MFSLQQRQNMNISQLFQWNINYGISAVVDTALISKAPVR